MMQEQICQYLHMDPVMQYWTLEVNCLLGE